MKAFFQKLMLLAAFAAILRILFSPSAIEMAGAALHALGKNADAETDTAASAVVAGESAGQPLPSPALQSLVLQTAAPQAGLFSTPAPSLSGTEPQLRNNTSYAIDSARLISEPLSYTLQPGTPQILIIHTHGSEAYSQLGGAYAESDTSRTTDISKNVVQVGSVLADKLSARGFTVLHDTGLYDYPSYSGSYSRSLAAVEEYLRKYPTIKVVIDLHRDSASTEGGEAYRTEYIAPDGSVSSQLMLIAATGEAGLSFPGWEENMKLALRLQARMEAVYPGLARPLLVSDQRYNQHAAPGYLLAEVGTDGNTLAEAEAAAGFFGECMADVLGEIVE